MSPRKKKEGLGLPRLTKTETNVLEQLRAAGGVDVSTWYVSVRLEGVTFDATIKLLESLAAKGRVQLGYSSDRLERQWTAK